MCEYEWVVVNEWCDIGTQTEQLNGSYVITNGSEQMASLIFAFQSHDLCAKPCLSRNGSNHLVFDNNTRASVCVHARVCVCARVCVHARVCVCARVYVCV